MAKGFLYLVVIMNWVSRAVLAWRVSNTLGADFCVEALEETLSRYGRPEIFNTDQGSQFTSDDYWRKLSRHREGPPAPVLFFRRSRPFSSSQVTTSPSVAPGGGYRRYGHRASDQRKLTVSVRRPC
jgi:transposase InsO family protein